MVCWGYGCDLGKMFGADFSFSVGWCTAGGGWGGEFPFLGIIFVVVLAKFHFGGWFPILQGSEVFSCPAVRGVPLIYHVYY